MSQSQSHVENNGKIPKIIHYCWFGGKPIPEDLQKCMDTWEKLHGYKIMRWDESNCSFNENDFVRKTYADKQLGFIGDYYRLKAVYEYGGIYLDTDVKVYKSFDNLLHHKAFLNFIFDCAVGTAIIGGQKGNPFLKGIMDMYDNSIVINRPDPKDRKKGVFEWKDGKLYVHGYATSNYYYTYYILNHYPEFRLNNKYQDMKDFVIYPKELFEIGTVFKKHYAIHLNAGAWRTNKSSETGLKGKIKRLLSRHQGIYDTIQVIIRKKRYRKLNKINPFYQYSVAQKNNKALPRLDFGKG